MGKFCKRVSVCTIQDTAFLICQGVWVLRCFDKDVDLVIYVNEFYLDNLKKVSAYIAGEETVYDFESFQRLWSMIKFFHLNIFVT